MYILSTILNKLNISYELIVNKNNDMFDNIAPYSDFNNRSLIFFNTYSDEIINSDAAVILLDSSIINNFKLTYFDKAKSSIFIVDNVKMVVSNILSFIYPTEDACFGGIHPTAYINKDAEIHSSVSIGFNCVIGKCKIGKNSKIYSSVVIKDGSVIGNNVNIREFCLVGGTGFGFSLNENHHYIRMPHIGNVVIEDHVELYPYVNVDRATLTTTIIRKGAKIDHYSHIGHNCIIGKHSAVAAGTIFSGKSSLGDYSFVGIGTTVKEGVKIGSNCKIGMGSVITKDTGDGWVVYGNPAKRIRRNVT
jgi:UDP-3-O-[3-hydroxymyristoyl] glucosamine N-acyltransferase